MTRREHAYDWLGSLPSLSRAREWFLDWVELIHTSIHSGDGVLSVQLLRASGLQLQKGRANQKQELAGVGLSPTEETFLNRDAAP